MLNNVLNPSFSTTLGSVASERRMVSVTRVDLTRSDQVLSGAYLGDAGESRYKITTL